MHLPQSPSQDSHLQIALLVKIYWSGKRLLQYGIERYAVQEVTVNEQNPQAIGFYEHMGFQTYRRTERDEQGGPYPLLYMRRVLPDVSSEGRF